MGRGQSVDATNLLYGQHPRARHRHRLAPLETTRHLPWPGLQRLGPRRCLELLASTDEAGWPYFPDTRGGRGTVWHGLQCRDRQGVSRVPCLTVGADGVANGQLSLIVSVLSLDDNDKVTAEDRLYVGDDLGQAVDAASAVANPLKRQPSPDSQRAIEISWTISERLNQVSPRTYADLAAAGML